MVLQAQRKVSEKPLPPVFDVGISTGVKEQLHGLQMAILGTAICDYFTFKYFL